jgi:flagellar biosynthetic protein FlhB
MRRTAREIARRRMMQDVPRASVVITNPTHLAVALHYERGVTAAPRVVAKGAGLVAKRIVDLARNHAVPVVERKPLARALFKSVPIGQAIPAALYYAAAEVLAYVYRLRNAA